LSYIKTWYTLAEAESKFGVTTELILKWVDDGLVRCETEKGTVARINADDLELKIAERSEEQ
jgi:predicted site-specific integrase-resolvase